MKRFDTALHILAGNEDLYPIAKALAAAADEAVSDGVGAECDPAVRAIAFQLGRLCRVDDISYGYDPATLADTFCTLMSECKRRAQEAQGGLVLDGPVTAHSGLGAGNRPAR